jgi:hypothetical protein
MSRKAHSAGTFGRLGAALFLTANAGGWPVLLWPLACLAMMA